MRAPPHVVLISQPHDPVTPGVHLNGSVAIVLLEIAHRLARTHRVTILAPRRRGQPKVETVGANLSIERIPFVLKRLHAAVDLAVDLCGGDRPYFTWSLYFKEYYLQVARRLAALRPDLVHLMTYPQAVPGLRAALPQARLVLHAHDGRLTRLAPAATARQLALVDAVVACNAWLTRAFAERFGALASRFHTIGNGVDLTRFQPAEGGRAAAAGQRLLYVGRVSPEKGVHLLIDAFVALAARWPELGLTLVGPAGLYPFSVARLLFDDPAIAAMRPFYGRGPWSRLRQEALGGKTGYLAALQARVPPALGERVVFQPPRPHHLIPATYQAADVVVLPSVFHEPFGIPVVEALASGVPVVASAVGGIPELVTPDCGILVERGRADALSDGLRTLLEQPERRVAMGEAARRRALEAFGWDDVADRLIGVYREVGGAARHSAPAAPRRVASA